MVAMRLVDESAPERSSRFQVPDPIGLLKECDGCGALIPEHPSFEHIDSTLKLTLLCGACRAIEQAHDAQLGSQPI